MSARIIHAADGSAVVFDVREKTAYIVGKAKHGYSSEDPAKALESAKALVKDRHATRLTKHDLRSLNDALAQIALLEAN